MQGPQRIATQRLILRRPEPQDAEAIFQRYAHDVDVTHFLAWPRHLDLDDTRAFLAFSDSEWETWPAGPFLVEDGASGRLLGSTGLGFETPTRATTGYVFARDAWGLGYATESLRAMVELAGDLGVAELVAHCHVDHRASHRVLEKAGFVNEGNMPRHSTFPNVSPQARIDVASYRLAWDVGTVGDNSEADDDRRFR